VARLLFDENLSPRLAPRLAVIHPGSQHVRDLGLLARPDHEIWDRAKAEGFTIVTKDDDFSRRSFLHGAPPEVIWLVVGNAGTEAVAAVLEGSTSTVAAFLSPTPNSPSSCSAFDRAEA